MNEMPYIELERLWVDADELTQLQVTASNDVQVGRQDFYAYPESIEAFAQELTDFPKKPSHEVNIEYGAPQDFKCHLGIRVFVLDGVGHSAIEITFDNREEPPLKARCQFYLTCEPATVNALGRRLLAWIGRKMDGAFRHEWKGGT
jgi:hypothetical protein